MEEMFLRFIENLGARVTGPMHFRVYMQPLMASFFAILAGLKDAGARKASYFTGRFTDPDHRREMITEGFKSVGRIFILAVLIDVAYQYLVQRWIYPGEALVTGLLLAIVPYIILRGLVDLIATQFSRRQRRV